MCRWVSSHCDAADAVPVREKLETMEPADAAEQSARKRKWRSAQQKLVERLGDLGLVLERDYLLLGEDWP
jgi:hypothetical protein